jgi:polysaccharide biosynthesis/export protein
MTIISPVYRGALGLICAGTLVLLTGCATSGVPVSPKSLGSIDSFPRATQPTPTSPPGLADAQELSDDNASALKALWRSRTADTSSSATNTSGFIIGPGDVLRISLPQLDQMKDRRVRVSEKETIDLPLLGVISVAGMTQEGLHDELCRRVEQYVYKPQVAVYLEHTENRVAAVLGAVKTPGRYMLAGPSDTIMTMLSRAGGPTEDAASRVIFIPAPATPAPAHAIAVADNQERPTGAMSDAPFGTANALVHGPDAHYSVSQQLMSEGVVIDLSHAVNERYMELPVRMGDVIIVPVAGEVTVQGWVQNPGAFKITRGMTVLSAIAAAGGALFSSSATLLREESNDTKLALPLNLDSIKNGSQRDVALQGGDVIVVERSVAGAIPYTAYFLINKMGWGIFPPL